MTTAGFVAWRRGQTRPTPGSSTWLARLVVSDGVRCCPQAKSSGRGRPPAWTYPRCVWRTGRHGSQFLGDVAGDRQDPSRCDAQLGGNTSPLCLSPGGRGLRDRLGSGGSAFLNMAAETVAEFIDDLRQLQVETGNPSLREIARLSRQHTKRLPHSTAGDLLKSVTRPPVRSVIAFVVACREYAKELGLDVPRSRTDLASWQLRWQALLPEASPEPPPVVDRVASGDTKGRRDDGQIRQERVWMPAPGSKYLILTWSDFGSLPALPELTRQTHDLASALASVAPWFAVTVLHNPTREQAHEAVQREAMLTQDVTFLHLATHAVLDEQDRLTLIMGDDQRRDAIPAEDLIRPLVRDKPVVVILDSCYAGGLKRDLGRDPAHPGLALVLAAAGATQFALAGEGSLTGLLARLFALGDPNLPPLLTVRSIYEWLIRAVDAGHLRTDVRLGTRQGPWAKPECIRFRPFADDIVIATNRAWVRPVSELPGSGIWP